MNVKEALLSTFAKAEGEYISGSALANKLGVSRNAVWKAVKSLESEGYCIESAAAKGYRLTPGNNHLAAGLILPRIKKGFPGGELQVYGEIDSTNSCAKKLASLGAPHGTVVIADKQTAGRGRLGRTFVSPSGTGIYMSIIIRPEFGIETAPLITSASAVAAAEAVEELCGSPVNIKWVNDLYMGGRKICGILTEASFGLEMKSLDFAVIGIGINVRRGNFPEELSHIATSVEEESGKVIDRNALCAAVIDHIADSISNIESRSFLTAYRQRELLTGNTITANVGGETLTGTALGVDDNANLIVRLEDGSERHLSSGEANLCRIK